MRISWLRSSPRYSALPRFLLTLWFRALFVGGGQLLPLPPHPLLVLDRQLFRVAGRTGSAPLPPLAPEVVSASRVERGRLLLPGPRVSGSRSHPLSGGCLSLHWQAWRDRGAEPWVVEVLRFGYHLPFLSTPPLSATPIPMPSSSPTSIKGAALEEVTLGLIVKGAVELAPLPSPSFYSCLFVVWKTLGSWRPVIDLSHLNRFVDVSHFQMETIQSALLSVRQGDWMASIDLKEAYLQVPVHPDSRHFLSFVYRDHVFQFKALCFGLSTAPQVFTRVMVPVSAILHSMGIRMRRYLDGWLVQSSSLRRGRSAPSSSSSPLTGPRSSAFSRGRPYGKCSSSSSRSGGRKRFKGGKGVAPSSGPSGFRK